MKNFPALISIITSLLVGYGFYSFNQGEKESTLRILISIIAFSYSYLTLMTVFVNKYESGRIKTIIGFTGSLFFIAGIILLILTATFTSSMVWLILPIGLLTLIYLSIIYFISKSGQ